MTDHPAKQAKEAMRKADGASACVGVTRGILAISLGAMMSIVVFTMLFRHRRTSFRPNL